MASYEDLQGKPQNPQEHPTNNFSHEAGQDHSTQPTTMDYFVAGARDFGDNVRGAVTGNHPPDMGFANRRKLLQREKKWKSSS